MDRRLALASLLGLVAGGVTWSVLRPRATGVPAATLPAAEPRDEAATYVELEPAETARPSRASAGVAETVVVPGGGPEVDVIVTTCKARHVRRTEVVPSVPVAIGVGAAPDPHWTPLVHAVTDAEGTARSRIPWTAVAAARDTPGARIWARVTGAGWQRQEASCALPATPGRVELELVALPGSTVRGRLLANGEAPVPGQVRLYTWSGRGPPGFGPTGDASADGWFGIHVRREGNYQVVAEAGAHGTAALRDLDVRFDVEMDPIELHVRGSGVVRGRVRDARGRTAPLLDLIVLLAALDEEGASLPPIGPAEARAFEGGGHTWATLRTDSEGRFEALGLRRDSYVVRAQTRSSPGRYPHLLTPVPVASDGVPLELSFDRQLLAVKVVEADGSPWPGGLSIWANGGRPPSGWPETPHLVVVRAREDAPGSGPLGPRFLGRLDEGGEYLFEVEDGGLFQLGLLGGARPWNPVEVSVPVSAMRVEVSLAVPEAVGTGALLLTVRDADGVAVDERLAIRVGDADTGMALFARDNLDGVTWPLRIELPEGRYGLVVEGTGLRRRKPRSEPKHGRFASTVDVFAARDRIVTATLPEGARVRVRISGSVGTEDREALRASRPDFTPEEVARWAEVVSLVRIAGGRWPEVIRFRPAIAGGISPSTLLLGSEATSELLPAGPCRIEARSAGGRVVARSVVLVDGETTDVDLSFD